jgi:hypothetical protein
MIPKMKVRNNSILCKLQRFNRDLREVGGKKAVKAFHENMKMHAVSPKKCLMDQMAWYRSRGHGWKNFSSASILMDGIIWCATPENKDEKYWEKIHTGLQAIYQREQEQLTKA